MGKYHNKKTVIGDMTFDSGAEARRYRELLLMVAAGEIIDLERQPKYPIVVNGEKVCTYIGDFRYHMLYEVDGIKRPGTAWFVEDVKGVKTPVYNLKKKLVSAIYGFDIIEVQA